MNKPPGLSRLKKLIRDKLVLPHIVWLSTTTPKPRTYVLFKTQSDRVDKLALSLVNNNRQDLR